MSSNRAFPWAVTAPFLDAPDARWISDFTTSDRHRFSVVPHVAGDTDWHQKKAQGTGLKEWRGFDATAAKLLSIAASEGGGAITVFPQLAATAAIRKRIGRKDVPLVAWFFNTTFRRDPKSLLARPALGAIDRFVVHSTNEIQAYADHLKIPTDRFTFAYVQYGAEIKTDPIDRDEPFVFATGSGFRDYGTLFEAVAKLGVPTKIVAGPRILAGLTPPPNVEILDGVDRHDIHRLVRQATVNVLPMTNEGLTAGLITIAEAFRHGRGLVATDRQGVEDYLQHDENSLLVPVGDAAAMAESIEAVFNDVDLQRRLDEGAAHAGEVRHTDEAAGKRLVEVLDLVLDRR